MRLAIDVSTDRLYNGRLSVYIALRLGRRTLWLSRWDAPRVLPYPKSDQAILWHQRAADMVWYCGRHIV